MPSITRSTTQEAIAPLRLSRAPGCPGGGRAMSSGRANSPSRKGRSISSMKPTAEAELSRLKLIRPSGCSTCWVMRPRRCS